MTLQIVFILFSTLVIPLIFIWWLWRANFKSKFDWLLLVIMAGSFLSLIYISGAWSWISFYLRYIYLILFVSGAIWAFRNCRACPFFIRRKEGEWFAVIVFSGATFLFASMLVFTLMGFSFSGDSVELSFPLRNGNYYIAQGGNSPLINIHHHPQSPLKFAIDISKLYPLGNRAGGIYPDELEKYAIYGDTVYSPCDAVVRQVEDGHPNSPVSEPDTVNFKGNFVKLQYGKVNVYLAHFMPGSIIVREGDSLLKGEPVARVGNSGFSTEPHLHIHAEVEDSSAFMGRRPVAILFNGKFLVRNNLMCMGK